MQLKHHLMIVSLLILSIFMGWKLFPAPKTEVSSAASQSPYSITIISASLGLNCSKMGFVNEQSSRDPFANSNPPSSNDLKLNNVLPKVSELCNGKVRCEIKNSEAILGINTKTFCINKQLEVEYRCFSFDRPWVLKALAEETIAIDCTDAQTRAGL